MKYVQIRISKHSCLDRVLKEISKEIWVKIKDLLPISEDPTELSFRLQKKITRAVNHRVHKYPNCGLTEACHDEIEGSPWMDYTDKIYMLSITDDLERFISNVANQALNSISNELPNDRRFEAFSLILTTFRHEFSKFLYFNPVCRTIPFCQLQL